MKAFTLKISIILLLAAVLTVAAGAEDQYGIGDYPAIRPIIETKDLKLPELWQNNVLPQYRVEVARDVVKAARRIAFEKLVSGVADIKLGDDMTVGSLLKRSDTPDVTPEFFVRGVRENGIIYRQDSLIVEVTMEVSRKSILGSIKCWLENHLSVEDQKYVIKLRDHIESLHEGQLRAFGVAAVDLKYVRPEYAAAQKKAIELVASVPAWVADVVQVRGQGEIKPSSEGPQKARDKAFADASEIARKTLMLKVEALKDFNGETVGKAVENTQELKAGMLALVGSVPVVKGTEVIIGDKAEVTLSLNLKEVWNLLLHYRLTH